MKRGPKGRASVARFGTGLVCAVYVLKRQDVCRSTFAEKPQTRAQRDGGHGLCKSSGINDLHQGGDRLSQTYFSNRQQFPTESNA